MMISCSYSFHFCLILSKKDIDNLNIFISNHDLHVLSIGLLKTSDDRQNTIAVISNLNHFVIKYMNGLYVCSVKLNIIINFIVLGRYARRTSNFSKIESEDNM